MRQLMPPGQLYTQRPDSVLQQVLNGLAAELDRIECRVLDLPRQLDPSEGEASLSDWERVLGLPDECSASSTTADARRRAVLGRLLSGGSLSRQFYINLARSLGYEIGIEEGTSAPFRVGRNRCGERLGSEGGIFQWTVIVAGGSTRYFTVGKSTTGEPLVITSDDLLECVILRAAPAHAGVRFRYLTAPPGGEYDHCWVTVYGENGQRFRLRQDDGVLYAIDEDGDLLDLGVVDGRWTVIDEAGQALHVFLDCQDVELDDCWLTVYGENGQRLRLETIDGELYVVDESGTALDLGVVNGRLTITDEDGDEITITLDCEEASLCWMAFEDQFGSFLKLYPISGAILVDTVSGSLALDAFGDQVTILDEHGAELVSAFICGDLEDECRLSFLSENGGDLWIEEQDGAVLVFGPGGPWRLDVQDEAVISLDEDGLPLRLSLDCGAPPAGSEECWLTMLSEAGQDLRVGELDGAVQIFGPGGPWNLTVANDAVTALDEDGQPILLQLDCGDPPTGSEEYRLQVDDESGGTLELRTESSDFYIGTGAGTRLLLDITDHELSVLDEAGNTLTLALLGGPQ